MEEKNDIARSAVEAVCRILGSVTPDEVWSEKRTYRIATARQLAMWYLVRLYGMSYNQAGQSIGKHHATVIYGVRQIEIMLERNRTKEDRRIVKAAEILQVRHFGDIRKDNKLEDRIIYEVNGSNFVFDGGQCRKSVEFDYGYIGVRVTAVYDWHSEDHDTELDGRWYDDGTENVADDLIDLAVNCWDIITGEEVPVDAAYIATMI